MNTTILMGRLTADPELKYTPSGVPVAQFSLAINRPGKDKGTDFFNCVAFNKTAESIATYVHKGNRLLVNGSLSQENFTKKDGTKVNQVKVIVNQFDFIESNKNSESQAMDSIPESDMDYDPFLSDD